MDRPRAMDDDAGAMVTASPSQHMDLGPELLQESMQGRRVPVAEQRVVAAGEDSGHPLTTLIEPLPTGDVDAVMLEVKRPALEAHLDRPRADAKPAELAMGNDAVPAVGQSRDRPVDSHLLYVGSIEVGIETRSSPPREVGAGGGYVRSISFVVHLRQSPAGGGALVARGLRQVGAILAPTGARAAGPRRMAASLVATSS